MPTGRMKTKTTVSKDGTVFQEQVPLDPIVDDREPKPEEEMEDQGEEELSPDEEQYLHVARKLGGAMLKFKVFRIVDGGERFCGSLSAKELDQDDPIRSLQTRFGGGNFKVYFFDPETGQEVGVSYDVEGEPRYGKEETSAGGGGVTLQLPKTSGSDPTVTAMMSFMSAQLLESQKMANSLMLKLADNRSNQQQGATIAGLSLDQLAVIKELFADRGKKEDSTERLREWLGVIKSIVETVPTLVGGGGETSGWLSVAQQIAPKVGEVLGAFAQNKAGVPPQAHPQALPGQSHPPQAQAQPAGADVIRNVFESMYLQPLLEAAKEDVDPYTLTFNFKAQFGGNTQDFIPALGLKSVQEFYERYPESKKYEDWFNEFFFFMFNPTSKPELEGDEEEEEEEAPSNGKASEKKKSAAKAKPKEEAKEAEVVG